MMRLILVMLLTLTLQAKEGEWFVGLEGGVAGSKLNTADSNLSREYAPSYGLKVGLREDHSRLYIGVDMSKDSGAQFSSVIAPYLALEGTSNIFDVISDIDARFFLGFRVGGTFSTVADSDVNAVMLGAQTGLIFMLPADFELETAYKHTFSFKNEASSFNTGTLYLGLNYKFSAYNE